MKQCAAEQCENLAPGTFEFCPKHWRRLKALHASTPAPTFTLEWNARATYHADIAGCVRALALDEGIDFTEDPIL